MAVFFKKKYMDAFTKILSFFSSIHLLPKVISLYASLLHRYVTIFLLKE